MEVHGALYLKIYLVDQVHKDTERDHFMRAEDAKTYGLIDNVIEKRVESPGLDKALSSGKDSKADKD